MFLGKTWMSWCNLIFQHYIGAKRFEVKRTPKLSQRKFEIFGGTLESRILKLLY